MMNYFVTIGVLIIAFSSVIISTLVTINGKLDRLIDKIEYLSAYKPLVEKEQSNALDKIRVEIRKKMRFDSFNEGIVSYDDINKIFDKYKTESGGL